MYVQDLESSVFSVLVVVNVKLLCQRKCFVVVVVVIFVWLVVCVCVWDLNLIRSPDLKKRFRDRKEMSEIGLNLWLLLLLLMLCLFCFSDAMVGKEFVKGEEIAERKTSGTNQSLSTKICINSRRRSLKTKEEEKKVALPVLFSLWLLANVRERVEEDKKGLKRETATTGDSYPNLSLTRNMSFFLPL